MGLLSWIQKQYKAAGETINNVVQTTKTISQEFWQGFSHWTNVWTMFESPGDYSKTFIAWVAAQTAVLKRAGKVFAYFALVRPLAAHSVRWTTGNHYGAELAILGTMDVLAGGYLIREATTAKFFDNTLYYSAVGYTSAVESSAVLSKQTADKPRLQRECGDGAVSYYLADLTNTVEYSIQVPISFVASSTQYLINFVVSYLPYPLNGAVSCVTTPLSALHEVYKIIWTGEPYMRYPLSADRTCNAHQEKKMLANVPYTAGEGAAFLVLHAMCLYLLNAVLPAETSVFGEGVKNYCLSEAIATTLALSFIIANTVKREQFPGKKVLPNYFYPAKAISRDLAVDVTDIGKQQYAEAKIENTTNWEEVIYAKIENVWNARLTWGLRNALIKNVPESWEQLAKRPSFKVYWKASDGSLLRGVKYLLELHKSNLSNGLRWAFLDKWASNLPWIGGEMRVGVPVLLKNGTGRILRAAVNILESMQREASPESINPATTTPPLIRAMLARQRADEPRIGILRLQDKKKRMQDKVVVPALEPMPEQAKEEVIPVAFLDVEAVVEEEVKKKDNPVSIAYVLEKVWVERTNVIAKRAESPTIVRDSENPGSRVGILVRKRK